MSVDRHDIERREHDAVRNDTARNGAAGGGESGWIDYEYAVVRIVPRAHLGAFLNIGVILFSRTADFLDACVEVDRDRVQSFAPEFDCDLLEEFAEAYVRLCRGDLDGAPIGTMSPSGRFHWLTSPRSGVLRTSEVHPGRCSDLAETLGRLFAMYCRDRGS